MKRSPSRRSDRGRAGRAVRDRMREDRRRILRAYAPRLLVFWVLCAVVSVPLLLIQPSDFAQGFLVAAMLAVALSMPVYALAINGLLHRGMGADAEAWTSDAMRTLDRRRWFILDDLYFDGLGNVDHVVVGPGQVFAVESKWCSLGVRVEPQLGSWSRQARGGARKIELLLKSKGVRRPVSPVVLIWGPRHDIHGQHFVDEGGVLVATGLGVEELKDEMRRRAPGGLLDHPACKALEAFGTIQDEAFAETASR